MSIAASGNRPLRLSGVAGPLGILAILLASAVLVHAPAVLFDVGVRNLDFNAHYAWTVQFAEALRAGDPYPHWMWRGNFGLGEIALLFYSPLFYYASGAVRLFTSSSWEAMRIVFIVSTILTGFYGWWLLRLFVTKAYAIVGAILVQWAPMIFMLFHYFNGFPWAVGFAALVALTFYGVRPGAFESWIDIPVSIAIAALVLTHLVSALMALICFSFMSLCFFRRGQSYRRGVRRALSWLVSAGAGLALSMFYLLPALSGMHLISPEIWTTSYTPWNAFAFPTVTALTFGMRWLTFQWTVPVIVLLGVGAATWQAYRGGNVSESFGEAGMLLLAGSWVSLFFASELSYPLWLINTPLRLVQFPHRFIYITSATGIVANLLALSRIRQTGWRKLAVAVPLLLGFSATAILSAKLSFFDGKPHHLSVDEAQPYRGQPEYRLQTQGEHWQDYYRAGGLAAECAANGLACRTIETSSMVQSWEVSATQPSHLRLPLFAFPAWRVTVDDMAASTAVDRATGLIAVDLPAGTHRVMAQWTRLAAEHTGLAVSGLVAVALAFVSARRSRRSRPIPNARGLDARSGG